MEGTTGNQPAVNCDGIDLVNGGDLALTAVGQAGLSGSNGPTSALRCGAKFGHERTYILSKKLTERGSL